MPFETVREHFIMRNAEALPEIVTMLGNRVAALGAMSMTNYAENLKITLTVDDAVFTNEGEDIPISIYNLTCRMKKANAFDLSMAYDGESYCSPFFDVCGPLHLGSRFEKYSEEEKQQFFYSYWTFDNLEFADSGSLYALGTKNGKLYSGDVPLEKVDKLPEQGEWDCLITDLCLDIEQFTDEDRSAIEAACRELMSMSCDDDYTVDDEGLTFYMMNIKLHTPAAAEKYIANVSSLMRLCKDFPGSFGYFADLSGKDVRLLHLEVHADGTAEIFLAET